MSTPNSVISQLQSDLRLANDATGANDATIHDAITTLISGFGSGVGIRKYTGAVTYTGNYSEISHNVNSSRYIMIVNVSFVPEETGGSWIAENIIGIYDENGLKFNNDIYNSVSAATRYKDGTRSTIVWCGNGSTKDLFSYNGNPLPKNIECTWELYDLSDV